MTILFISSLISATGNLSTAQRLTCHFPKNYCILKPYCEIVKNANDCHRNQLNTYFHENKYDYLITLHAFKCGFLLNCSCEQNCSQTEIKYSIVFGGTDLNEDVKDPVKLFIIKKAIENSDKCIAFTNDLERISKEIVPLSNVFVQPQGVFITHDIETTSIESDCKLFLLMSGIRPVKDPIFIIKAFKELSQLLPKGQRIKLLIVGTVLDEKYFKGFIKQLPQNYNDITSFQNVEEVSHWVQNGEDTVRYSKSLPHDELMRLLESGLTFCVVNSSLSEGMCVSILEAMSYRVPVIARNIPGNEAIIKDSTNGLLFSDESEFVSKAKILLLDASFRKTIVTNALKSVMEDFSIEKEREFYLKHFYMQ